MKNCLFDRDSGETTHADSLPATHKSNNKTDSYTQVSEWKKARNLHWRGLKSVSIKADFF